MKIEEIVTDEELIVAFQHANFGNVSDRDILKYAVLKCAAGYHQGFTSKKIATELGLITWKYNVTKKGREYLWAAFASGTNF